MEVEQSINEEDMGEVDEYEELLKMTEFKDFALHTESSEARNFPYNKCYITFLIIVGCLSGLLFGYSTGIIAGAQLYFKDTWPEITTAERSLCVSLTLLGAFFGSLIPGFFSKFIGRKIFIIISDILFVTGALTMAFADKVYVVMIGRFTVGLAVGMSSMIVPVYLSEKAPTSIRGVVVTFYVVAISIG